MVKIFSFANLKGGTGKTSLCINIAGYLAQQKTRNKVLVVDFDPQADATSGLGIDSKNLEYSIYNAVLSQCEGYEDIAIARTIVATDVENLHLIPSELNLGVAIMVTQKVRDRVGILDRILKPIQQYYDYILIDTPSDTGLFMLNSLRVADRVIVPIDPSVFALEALENLKLYCRDIATITGHDMNDKYTLVLNRYSKSSTKGKKGKASPSEEVEAQLKTQTYPFFIVPDSILVYRSQQEGLPVSHYAPHSLLGKAYSAIANSLITNNS